MMKAQIRELLFEDTHDWFYNNLALLFITVLPFKQLLGTPQCSTSASLSSSPNDIINIARYTSLSFTFVHSQVI